MLISDFKMGVCHADDLYYIFDPIFGYPPDILTGEVLMTNIHLATTYRQPDTE